MAGRCGASCGRHRQTCARQLLHGSARIDPSNHPAVYVRWRWEANGVSVLSRHSSEPQDAQHAVRQGCAWPIITFSVRSEIQAEAKSEPTEAEIAVASCPTWTIAEPRSQSFKLFYRQFLMDKQFHAHILLKMSPGALPVGQVCCSTATHGGAEVACRPRTFVLNG